MTDKKDGSKLDTKDDSKPGSASSGKGDKAEGAKDTKSKKTKTKKTSKSSSKKSSTASATPGGKRVTNGHMALKDKAHGSPKPSPKPGATPEPPLEKQTTSEDIKVKRQNSVLPAGLLPAGEPGCVFIQY